VIYEVVSGRPAGNVYHDYVFVCDSREQAEDCIRCIEEYIERTYTKNVEWLWGPSYYKHDNDYVVMTWDGWDEIKAEKWQGQEL
jgi:hypothetical protein